jgi:hypothetical protein
MVNFSVGKFSNVLILRFISTFKYNATGVVNASTQIRTRKTFFYSVYGGRFKFKSANSAIGLLNKKNAIIPYSLRAII